jgi:hypothetical protein
MPYFVASITDRRVRRFAYPHARLETAMDFAWEVLKTGCSDVWVSDERGQKVADRQAVTDYADETGDD